MRFYWLRRTVLFLLMFSVCLSAATFLFFQTQIPQNTLKPFIEHELSRNFKHTITIEKLSGNLIFSTTFHHVRFHNPPQFGKGVILDIGKLTAHYSLIKVILFKGDFAKASSIVQLSNIRLNAVRNRQDDWTVFYILPPPDPKAPPPTFTGKLLFRDLTLYFTDQKGWGPNPLETPFYTVMPHFSGVMDFKRLKKAKLFLNGYADGKRSPIELNGVMNAYNGLMTMRITASELNLPKWGAYTVPIQGVHFIAGTASIKGIIRSKKNPSKTDSPFWYDLDLSVKNTTLVLPFLTPPITEGKGSFRLTHRTHACTQLDVRVAQGNVLRIPAAVKGSFFLSEGKVNLNIESKPFDLTELVSLFHIPLKLSGKALSQFKITGKTQSPTVEGTLDSVSSFIENTPLQHAQWHYVYSNHAMDLTLISALLYKGIGRGKAAFDFTQTPSKIGGGIEFKAIPISQFLSSKSSYPGSFDGTVHFEGSSERLRISAHLLGEKVAFFQQSLRSLELTGSLSQDRDLTIENLTLQLHPSSEYGALVFSGKLTALHRLSLLFKGQAIPFRDIDPSSNNRAIGKLTLSGSLDIPLNATFWVHPLSQIHCTLNAQVKDLPFYSHLYAQTSLNGSFHQGTLWVQHLSASQGGELLSMSGIFTDFKPTTLSFSCKNWDVSQPFLQNYIPSRFKPLGGGLNANISLIKNAISSTQNTALKYWKWLENYSVIGKIELGNGDFQNQPFERASLVARWNGEFLEIQNVTLLQGISHVSLHGKIHSNKQMELNFEEGSKIDLSDFQILTSPLGQFSGILSLRGSFEGTPSQPVIKMSVEATPFKSTFLLFDHVKGQFEYSKGHIKASPLLFTQGKETYQLNGYLNINTFMQEKMSLSDLNFKLEVSIKNVELDNFANLLEGLQKEIRQHTGGLTTHFVKEKIMNPNVQISEHSQELKIIEDLFKPRQAVPLYASDSTPSVLAHFQEKYSQFQEAEKPSDLGIQNLFKGQLSLELSAESRGAQAPKVSAHITLTNTEILFARAKTLLCTLQNNDQTVNFTLLFQDGFLGSKAVGTFLVKGNVDGQGTLHMTESELNTQKRTHNIVLGDIPLSPFWDPKNESLPLKIAFSIDGADLGLLSILNPVIQDITSEGKVSVGLTGTLKNPVINSSKIELKNTRILFNKTLSIVESPWVITSNSLVIENNKVIFPETHILWKGKDTFSLRAPHEMENHLIVSGTAELKNLDFLSFIQCEALLNLSLKNTLIHTHFNKIYNGEVALSDIVLKGSYLIPFSKEAKADAQKRIDKDQEIGPVLSGHVALSNAEIALPSLGKKTPKPSFLLNLECAIQSDVSLSGSLLGDDVFADLGNKFQLTFLETPTDVKISGSLNTPKLQNTLAFSEGIVDLFNREFTLLTTDKQKAYYPGNETQAHRNTLALSTQEDKDTGIIRNIPILDIAAVTIVEKTTTSSVSSRGSDPDSDKDKHIIAIIKGSIYNIDSLSFDKFTYSTKPDFKANYTAQDLSKVLEILAPDFFDIANSRQVNSDQTKRIISQIGETGVNTALRYKLIRPIEKNIAKNIGLSDLRFDYNVGSALFGAANIQGVGNVNSNVGLSMIKNLVSDQLSLRIKTNLDLKGQTDAQVSEWELTYNLYKHLSMNYSNVRETLGAEFKPKVSLKYSYDY